MKIKLEHDLSVYRVVTYAEMAWLERRPELGVLCRQARDHGSLISSKIILEALPGIGDAGVKNVVRWCKTLGLCNDYGALTSLGSDVAQSDMAPVPEQGIYEMWIVRHELTGDRALHAKRMMSETSHHHMSDLQPIDVLPELGKTFTSVLGSDDQFLVRSLQRNHDVVQGVCEEARTSIKLTWHLSEHEDAWELSGHIESSARAISHASEHGGQDIWELMNRMSHAHLSNAGAWDSKEHRLAVPFDKQNFNELDTFKKNLPCKNVNVPGKGSFDTVTLLDVPIGPAHKKDAGRWAMSRFEHKVQCDHRYRTHTQAKDLWRDLVDETPLEHFAPVLPEHGDLVHELSTDQGVYWELCAPEDLQPERVITQHARPTVQIPYKGRWSMYDLLQKLLEGLTPRTILLCDRYVRDENVDMLEHFVNAAKAISPGVNIEIWTELMNNADTSRIETITGRRPLDYRSIFEGGWPHDRYILIRDQTQNVGWHMSNSPLHARFHGEPATEHSNLRWKDFVASHVFAETLEPELRKWLEEETG